VFGRPTSSTVGERGISERVRDANAPADDSSAEVFGRPTPSTRGESGLAERAERLLAASGPTDDTAAGVFGRPTPSTRGESSISERLLAANAPAEDGTAGVFGRPTSSTVDEPGVSERLLAANEPAGDTTAEVFGRPTPSTRGESGLAERLLDANGPAEGGTESVFGRPTPSTRGERALSDRVSGLTDLTLRFGPAGSGSTGSTRSRSATSSGLSEPLGSGGSGPVLTSEQVDAGEPLTGNSERMAVPSATGRGGSGSSDSPSLFETRESSGSDSRQQNPPLYSEVEEERGTAGLIERLRVREFMGGSTDRAQAQIPRGLGGGRSTTGSEINDDRVTANLYQQSVDRQVRDTRSVLEGGDYDGSGSPFRETTERDRRQRDYDRRQRRERISPVRPGESESSAGALDRSRYTGPQLEAESSGLTRSRGRLVETNVDAGTDSPMSRARESGAASVSTSDGLLGGSGRSDTGSRLSDLLRPDSRSDTGSQARPRQDNRQNTRLRNELGLESETESAVESRARSGLEGRSESRSESRSELRMGLELESSSNRRREFGGLDLRGDQDDSPSMFGGESPFGGVVERDLVNPFTGE
jgi:hypothetical protein